MKYRFVLSSDLQTGRHELWRWITSVDGISREMAPYLRMTVPKGIADLDSLCFEPGKPIFRSWLLFLKIIPFDYSDFALESVAAEEGFVEQSAMGSMRTWRHARRISPSKDGYTLTDELMFEPRFAGWLTNRVVRLFFEHRHRRLKQQFNRR